MKACALVAVGRMSVIDVPSPPPAVNEIRIAPAAVGLCGTDFHIFSGEFNFNLDENGEPIPLETAPQVLGHEVVGTIVDVGAGVEDLRVGQRVLIDQGRNCLSDAREPRCAFCSTGDSHQCAHYREHGITGLPGGLAERMTVPAVNAVAVTGELPGEEVVLAEPLGCVLHSLERTVQAGGRYRFGERDAARNIRNVLVFGGGPAGLLFVQALRNVLKFDGRLFLSEPRQEKRALAESMGAETHDPAAADLKHEIAELTSGRGVELVIEATGAGTVYEEVPGVIAKQATLLAFGVGHGAARMDLLNAVQWKEPTVVMSVGASGSFDDDGRPSIYRRALRHLERGDVQGGPLITHRYRGLEEVPRAFAEDPMRSDYVKGIALLDVV